MHKANKAVAPRGRKPILSKANLASVGSAAQGIRSSLGRLAGAGITAAARAVIGSVFGQGDYTVKYNSLSGVGGPPQFSSNGNNRSVVISHREFVQDITGTTGFSIQSFQITPTNSALFPWLAQISSNFEEYRIHGMLFEFKTTSGMSVSSTNTALGTVIMATQYNPNDTAFSTKIDMENYEFATTGGPFESFLHPLECKPQLTVAPQLYVNQPNTSGAVVDLRLTNFGNFNIATVGMQASNVVGELWVSYQVELLKPRLSSVLVGNGRINMAFTSNTSAANLFGTNGSTIANITVDPPTNGERSLYINGLTAQFATAAALVNTPLNTGMNVATGSILTLPNTFQAGHAFGLICWVKGTGIGGNITLVATATGVTFTVGGFRNITSADSTLTVLECQLLINTLGDRTIQFTVAGGATTVTECDFVLTSDF